MLGFTVAIYVFIMESFSLMLEAVDLVSMIYFLGSTLKNRYIQVILPTLYLMLLVMILEVPNSVSEFFGQWYSW